MMTPDYEARTALCMNRMLEQHGPCYEGLSQQTRKGVALLAGRLDMIEPKQFNINVLITDLDGAWIKHKLNTTEGLDAWVKDPQSACGTVACLAGWMIYDMCVFGAGPEGPLPMEDYAQEFMGLSYAEARALFFPPGISAHTDDQYTIAQAKQVLAHCWKTGEINWGLALEGELA